MAIGVSFVQSDIESLIVKRDMYNLLGDTAKNLGY